MFFKTEPPVDPVALVKRICSDAIQHQARKRTRFVRRLSPMTLMGRASEEGLDAVARSVLAPYFHSDPVVPHKVWTFLRSDPTLRLTGLYQFAIRPTLRNHNTLSRDKIIQQVARIVGPDHTVDLKNYDLLIIVEAYKVSHHCAQCELSASSKILISLMCRTSVAFQFLTKTSRR